MSLPRERRFGIDGLELASLEWEGSGMPVIALHGWLDNAASFLPLAPCLDDVHLLAPDMVGHGHSDHLPAAATYHLSDYCRWVVGLADTMGWRRFVLVGHSMGAAVASITAAALPSRVEGLVLLDGLGPLALTPAQSLQRLRQLFSPSRARPLSAGLPSLESAARLRQRMGRFPISREAARLLVGRGTAEREGGYRWRHDARLKGPSSHYYSAEQAEAILRGIEAPTLLISAEKGALSGWDGLGRRKACVGNLRHSVLAGNHHLHMEHPEEVAAAINDFLNSLE